MLVKITAKRKEDVSDFKLDCGKMLIMKFLLAWFKFQAKIPSCSVLFLQEEC